MGWEQLNEAYNERGLVLVLGAGVSKGCGIPEWSELLQRVLEDSKAEVRVDDLYSVPRELDRPIR